MRPDPPRYPPVESLWINKVGPWSLDDCHQAVQNTADRSADRSVKISMHGLGTLVVSSSPSRCPTAPPCSSRSSAAWAASHLASGDENQTARTTPPRILSTGCIFLLEGTIEGSTPFPDCFQIRRVSTTHQGMNRVRTDLQEHRRQALERSWLQQRGQAA